MLNKKKLILAGVSTDVCLAIAAISAVNGGFSFCYRSEL